MKNFVISKEKNFINLFLLLAESNQMFHYARCITPKACIEFTGLISASLRPGNAVPFNEMLQRWRVVGNTVSNLTGPRFETQTSRSRDERVTA